MNRHIKWAVLCLSLISIFVFVDKSWATSSSLVINQVQLGDSLSASDEFIELRNNNLQPIDVTNWCLYYASSANLTNGNKLNCLTPESESTHIFVPGDMSIFFVSSTFSTNYMNVGFDLKFGAGLGGTGGHIRLIDSQDLVVDKLGWGSAASPESFAASVPGTGMVLSRIVDAENKSQDTDNNLLDFSTIKPDEVYSYGSLYEVVDLCLNIPGIQDLMPDGMMDDKYGGCIDILVDVCQNIDGIQIAIPQGFGLDENGDCAIDVCGNIDGLQSKIPEGLVVSDGDQCHLPDVCINIDDLQINVPDGYYLDEISGKCLLDLPRIQINEIMPNPAGSDSGNEFIEIYNPNDVSVNLDNYKLQVGGKYILFPSGTKVEPNSYYVIQNNVTSYTLTNTGSSVGLWTSDDVLMGENINYSSALEGESWSYFKDGWQYTNRPTPGEVNLINYLKPKVATVSVVSELKQCAPNQYRNPETNRCRLIATVGSVLTACKVGQYRSETTNRCRSIASDAAVLAACDDNQERSPETNRCRNIVSNVIPEAAFAVEPFYDPQNDSQQWLVLSFVFFATMFYAVWEWRPEIKKLFTR